MKAERINIKPIRAEHHHRVNSSMTESAKAHKLNVKEIEDD